VNVFEIGILLGCLPCFFLYNPLVLKSSCTCEKKQNERKDDNYRHVKYKIFSPSFSSTNGFNRTKDEKKKKSKIQLYLVNESNLPSNRCLIQRNTRKKTI
jgi:hypothetical protein